MSRIQNTLNHIICIRINLAFSWNRYAFDEFDYGKDMVVSVGKSAYEFRVGGVLRTTASSYFIGRAVIEWPAVPPKLVFVGEPATGSSKPFKATATVPGLSKYDCATKELVKEAKGLPGWAWITTTGKKNISPVLHLHSAALPCEQWWGSFACIASAQCRVAIRVVSKSAPQTAYYYQQ